MAKILALVLAGGNGSRLHPLTAEHAKPALPFAQGYRIIDFVLSNLVNSKIPLIYVLAQYKPASLIEHIRAAWWALPGRHEITVLLPRAYRPGDSFAGTADAVYQNLHLLERHRPDLVAVFAADHVYRMDVRQMVEFHVRRNAEVSVAAVPVPIANASRFGIMATDGDGWISAFQEKPARPVPMPNDPSRAYASMGNYLFQPDVLIALLDAGHRSGETDFGRHILPRAVLSRRVLAYDFAGNKVPGIRPHEEQGYWRDIGTPAAYRAAQRDVLGQRPRFSLVNREWPIRRDRYRVFGGGAANGARASGRWKVAADKCRGWR